MRKPPTFPTAEETAAKPRLRLDLNLMAVVCVLLATTIMRLAVGYDRPLWLDETQTGMLASQLSLADFIRQCTYDINAPLYAILAALWAKVSGISDHALRLLPAAFGTLAPLVVLAAPRGLFRRPIRLTWCALVACWIPGLWYSQEARGYTLVLALAVANGVAFAAVLSAPRQRALWAWAVASALLIAAHDFGAILIAVQALILLGIHRFRILGWWPIAFLPNFAVLAVQLRGLLSFAHAGTGWIRLAVPWDLAVWASFIFGPMTLILATLVWLALAAYFHLRSQMRPEPVSAERATHRSASRLSLVSAASFGALAVAAILGFLLPVVVERYFVAFVPGILLGLAILAGRVETAWPLAPLALVAVYAAAAISWASEPHRYDNIFNWETASSALMTTHPQRLVFLWDTPMRVPKSTLDGLGGFFFRRAGQTVTIDSIQLRPGEDPNRLLLAHASPPGSAILWVYDLAVDGTAAITHRPAISRLAPVWRCRNFGIGRFGVLACTIPSHHSRRLSRSSVVAASLE